MLQIDISIKDTIYSSPLLNVGRNDAQQSIGLKKPKKEKKNLLECREEEKKENIQADMLSPTLHSRCPVCTKASSLTLHNGKHNISTRVGTKYARLLLHYSAGGLISNTWIGGHFFILAVYVNVVKGISDTKPEMNHQNSFLSSQSAPVVVCTQWNGRS